jgi:hypothetical protein
MAEIIAPINVASAAMTSAIKSRSKKVITQCL